MSFSHLFGTISVLPTRTILSEAVKIFRQEVPKVREVDGLTPFFICYPLQRNAILAMKQRGGNALGIYQDEPLFCEFAYFLLLIGEVGCNVWEKRW